MKVAFSKDQACKTSLSPTTHCHEEEDVMEVAGLLITMLVFGFMIFRLVGDLTANG